MKTSIRTTLRRILALTVLNVSGPFSSAHEFTRRNFEVSLDRREENRLIASGVLAQVSSNALNSGRNCHLRLQVIDAATRQATPALIRITNATGRALELPGLVSRGIKLRANHPAKHWYFLPENAVISLPAEQLTIEAFAGLETDLATAALDLRGKSTAGHVLPLQRLAAPARAGWHGGNTHLHLRGLTRTQADEYLRTVPRGDGLELVFVSYLERANADEDYITNTFSAADLGALELPQLKFGNGEEHRHNFGSGGEGYGHVMFLNLPALVRPVSIGSGITGKGPDYPPLERGMDLARQQGATIIWCHNALGLEHGPSWLRGRLDAHNIFDGGSQGTYADTFYRLLNLGLKVPFSTGTDWFIYDFSRVYVQLPSAVTVQNWLRGLAAGKTFITNGPLLELQAGGHEIGDTVRISGTARLPVRARAVGRNDFQGLELVYNGKVVQRAASRVERGHFVAELEYALAVDQSGWVAARITGGTAEGDGNLVVPPSLPIRGSGTNTNELGEALFAHTSPIYFEVPGRPIFSLEAAEAMIRRMDESMRSIRTKAEFENDAQREEVLQNYREAIEQLRRRLKP